MQKATPITEQFQHFVTELKETFWGDVYGKTKGLWKTLLEEDSEAQMARYLGLDPYERGCEEQPLIFAIFNRFNQEWKNRTLKNFTQAA